MSPVEIFGTARWAAMNSAWVPLPAPGGPTSTSRTYIASLRRERAPHVADARAPRPRVPTTGGTLVVALHQLALDLLHRLQAHAHHDEHRRTTEREVLVLLLIEPDEEEVRQDRDHTEVERTRQGDPAEDEVQVVGGRLTGA